MNESTRTDRTPRARRAWRALATTALLATMASATLSATAGALEDGLAAYQAKDYIRALQLWRPLAEQGDADAQYEVGTLYAEGKGVAASDLIAATWFQRAAEQGVAGAQYNLAVSFAEGLGVRKDDAMAAKWFRRAADQGMPYAQLNLGLMYAAARGVPKDNIEAVRWLELAIFGLPAGGARSDAAKALKSAADQLSDEDLLKARTLQRSFQPMPEARHAEIAPSLTKPTDAKPADVKPADTKAGDAKPAAPK